MVAMFFFALIANLLGWGAILGTDYLLGTSPTVLSTVSLFEWVLIPIGFVAVYHYFIKGDYAKPGHVVRFVILSLLMWCAVGAGVAFGALMLIKKEMVLFTPVLKEMDYMMFAAALVLGFAFVSAMIEFAWFMFNKPEKRRYSFNR